MCTEMFQSVYSEFLCEGWPLTKSGSDRIGSDRTHKTWIGSNSIKETHIYSLKVGAFQIPIKNGQVVSLNQNDE